MDRPSNTDNYWHHRAHAFDAFYSRVGRLAPRRLVSTFLGARTRLLERFVQVVPQSEILDVGCGSGVHMKMLCSRCGHGGHVRGVDYSEPMVRAAARNLEDSRASNWSLSVGDARSLPFRQGTFDLVVSMGLLDYVPRPADVLAECCRVLTDGGSMVFTIPKTPSAFFFLRTRFGNVVKEKMFDLPPIANAISRNELEDLTRAVSLRMTHVDTVWSTMWMVRAVKMSS